MVGVIFNSFFSSIAYSLIASYAVYAIYSAYEMRCMTLHRKIEFSNVKNAHLKMSNDIFAHIHIHDTCTCVIRYDICWHGVSRMNFIISYNGIHTFSSQRHKEKRTERKPFGQHIYHFRVFNSILPINIFASISCLCDSQTHRMCVCVGAALLVVVVIFLYSYDQANRNQH